MPAPAEVEPDVPFVPDPDIVRYGLRQGYAQRLLDDPSSSGMADTVAQLAVDLCAAHGIESLDDPDPAKTQQVYDALRDMRSTMRAAHVLRTICGAIAAHNVIRPNLPRALRGDCYLDADVGTKLDDASYKGDALLWLNYMHVGPLSESMERLGLDRFSTSLSPHLHRVYQLLALNRFEKGRIPSIIAERRVQTAVDSDNYYFNRDNITSGFDTILSAQHAITLERPDVALDADTMAETLFGNIPAMARLTEIKRTVLLSELPWPHEHQYPETVFEAGGSDISRVAGVFKYTGELLVPTHVTFAAAKTIAGKCPAEFQLSLNGQDSALTEAVAEFANTIGHPELGPDKHGRLRSGRLLLALGIDIARYTTFKPRKSPVIHAALRQIKQEPRTKASVILLADQDAA